MPNFGSPGFQSVGLNATAVSSQEGFEALCQSWADQHGGRFPQTLIHLRKDDTKARRVAQRQASRQVRPAAFPAPSKGNNSASTKDKDSGPEQDMQMSGRPSKRQKRDVCGWCDKPGHEVKDCAGPPAEDGFIHACGIHNTKAHTFKDCSVAADWDTAMKWSNLVSQRANLPPLVANYDWEDVAYYYITAAKARAEVDPTWPLPLSTDFVRIIDKKKFDEFDYSVDARGQLGIDETTSSVKNFMRWCGHDTGYDGADGA
ncbi:hypothetical protein PG993_004022 [Apiospora rasikravindrae]|uniref:CCHC-type domain-containing protein n=1 Tax=Apiospora rasikravindrae TaxID=990691 RepID=A0ABR1TE89_9PEZI